MVDDLDGVSTSSSAPDYDPGNRYRVKELDPDEAGGGKDFYDGFMRRKKEKKDGEEDEKEDSGNPADAHAEENPIPVVEKEIHDDVILSQRARKILDNVNEEESPPESSSQEDEEEASPPSAGHINFKA